MRGKRNTLCPLQVENENIESALCGNTGIFLPKRAGGSVARIFKRSLSLFVLSLHQRLKAIPRHINFPAHFKIWNSLIKPQRD